MKERFTIVTSCLLISASFPSMAGKIDRAVELAEERLSEIQSQLAASTAEIGRPGRALHAELSYDPIIEWSKLYSATPESSRIIRFQQIDRSGELLKQSHRCRLFGEKRDGYWVRIDEARSTQATWILRSVTAEAQPDGLAFFIPMDIRARSQVGFNFRPRCTGGSLGGNVGVTGEARPNSVFKLKFDSTTGSALRYSLDLVSPDHINVEVAGHVDPIGRVRFTIPIDNIAQKLRKV